MSEEIKDVTLKEGAMAFLSILVAVAVLRIALGEESFIKLALWVLNLITYGQFNL